MRSAGEGREKKEYPRANWAESAWKTAVALKGTEVDVTGKKRGKKQELGRTMRRVAKRKGGQ